MYLAANGIIMGKAALDELQDGGNSVNPTNRYADGLITTMLNAYNQTRIAGGVHLFTTLHKKHSLTCGCQQITNRFDASSELRMSTSDMLTELQFV